MTTVAPMFVINKLTKALEAIASTASRNDPNLLGTIEVLASEMLKETAEDIETIKREAMAA